MRERSGRSIGPSTDRAAPTRGVDVYLFPAVVGGGLGDIEEVLAAGRYLAAAGFRPTLYRAEGRALPQDVDGPWEWPPVERRRSIDRRGAAALTLAPSWGVSAAPSRPVRFGRGGPWEVECRNVEAAYGPDRTLHVSLEEFARTLSSREETRERFREGGVPAHALPSRLRAAEAAQEVPTFRAAFREFRDSTGRTSSIFSRRSVRTARSPGSSRRPCRPGRSAPVTVPPARPAVGPGRGPGNGSGMRARPARSESRPRSSAAFQKRGLG